MPSYIFERGAINTVTIKWDTELGLGERLVEAVFEMPDGLTRIGQALEDEQASIRFAIDEGIAAGQTLKIQLWVRTSAGNRWPAPIFVFIP